MGLVGGTGARAIEGHSPSSYRPQSQPLRGRAMNQQLTAEIGSGFLRTKIAEVAKTFIFQHDSLNRSSTEKEMVRNSKTSMQKRH